MTMHSLRWIFVLVASLTGCVAPPTRPASLDGQSSCCTSVAQLRHVRAELEDGLSLQFGDGAQVFAFPDGNSYVHAIELPSIAEPRVLRMRSYFSGGYLPAATVFLPVFVILDAERKEIRTASNLQLTQGVDFFKGAYYRAAIPLEPGDAFVVLRANTAALGGSLPFVNAKAGFAFSTGTSSTFVPPQSSSRRIPIVATGKVELEVGLATAAR